MPLQLDSVFGMGRKIHRNHKESKEDSRDMLDLQNEPFDSDTKNETNFDFDMKEKRLEEEEFKEITSKIEMDGEENLLTSKNQDDDCSSSNLSGNSKNLSPHMKAPTKSSESPPAVIRVGSEYQALIPRQLYNLSTSSNSSLSTQASKAKKMKSVKESRLSTNNKNFLIASKIALASRGTPTTGDPLRSPCKLWATKFEERIPEESLGKDGVVIIEQCPHIEKEARRSMQVWSSDYDLSQLLTLENYLDEQMNPRKSRIRPTSLHASDSGGSSNSTNKLRLILSNTSLTSVSLPGNFSPIQNVNNDQSKTNPSFLSSNSGSKTKTGHRSSSLVNETDRKNDFNITSSSSKNKRNNESNTVLTKTSSDMMGQKRSSRSRSSVKLSNETSIRKIRSQQLFQESQKIIRPSYTKRLENAMRVLYKSQDIEMAKKASSFIEVPSRKMSQDSSPIECSGQSTLEYVNQENSQSSSIIDVSGRTNNSSITIEENFEDDRDKNENSLPLRSIWTYEDYELFLSGIKTYRKDFSSIQRECLPHHSLKDVISLYYKWKFSEAHKEWNEYELSELAERRINDFHIDICHECNDGGDLICCDTCNLAYHLRCVNLEEEPDGLWACPICLRDYTDQKSMENAVNYVKKQVAQVNLRREKRKKELKKQFNKEIKEGFAGNGKPAVWYPYSSMSKEASEKRKNKKRKTSKLKQLGKTDSASNSTVETTDSEPETRIKRLREEKSKENSTETNHVQISFMGAKRRKPQRSPEYIAAGREAARNYGEESNLSHKERSSSNSKRNNKIDQQQYSKHQKGHIGNKVNVASESASKSVCKSNEKGTTLKGPITGTTANDNITSSKGIAVWRQLKKDVAA